MMAISDSLLIWSQAGRCWSTHLAVFVSIMHWSSAVAVPRVPSNVSSRGPQGFWVLTDLHNRKILLTPHERELTEAKMITSWRTQPTFILITFVLVPGTSILVLGVWFFVLFFSIRYERMTSYIHKNLIYFDVSDVGCHRIVREKPNGRISSPLNTKHHTWSRVRRHFYDRRL